MGKFSRMIQDSILFEMSITETEIRRLEDKEQTEGLSNPEYHTLTMLKRKLKRLRSKRLRSM